MKLIIFNAWKFVCGFFSDRVENLCYILVGMGLLWISREDHMNTVDEKQI